MATENATPVHADGPYDTVARILASHFGRPVPTERDRVVAAEIVEALTAERDRLAAENERLRAENAKLSEPEFFWEYEDPEASHNDWKDAVDLLPLGEVAHLITGRSLADVWATTRVLTVDDDGDADETEPALFASAAEANACFDDSLAAARALSQERPA